MTDSMDECRAHIAEMRAEREGETPEMLYHGMQVPALLVATALRNCHAVAPTYSGDEMTHQDVALYMCRVFQNLHEEKTRFVNSLFGPGDRGYDHKRASDDLAFSPHEFLVRCGLTEDVAAFLLLEGGEADSEPTAEQDQEEVEALDDEDLHPKSML